MISYVMRFHEYKDRWTPTLNEQLVAVRQPENLMDKYVVAVINKCNNEDVVHLMKDTNGIYVKIMFYFLGPHESNRCTVIVSGEPENLGKGLEKQVP